MTYPELLDAIRKHDIRFELELVIDAPSGVVTDELRAALAEHKPHLLAKLGREAQLAALAQQRWGPALKPPTGGEPDKTDKSPSGPEPGQSNSQEPKNPNTYSEVTDKTDKSLSDNCETPLLSVLTVGSGNVNEFSDGQPDSYDRDEREAIIAECNWPTLGKYDMEPVDPAGFPEFDDLPGPADLERAQDVNQALQGNSKKAPPR